jgi:hypothetical protein
MSLTPHARLRDSGGDRTPKWKIDNIPAEIQTVDEYWGKVRFRIRHHIVHG